MLVLITFFIALITSILFYVHRKWEEDDAKMGISGPPCLPVLGNILEMKKYFKDDTANDRYLEFFEKYGDTFRLRLGPKLIIFTRDIKVVENIVNNPKFKKSSDYKLYEPWLGDGLLLSHGEKWHKLRKLLTPAFHFEILERFIPIYEDHGKIFVDKIRKLGEDKAVSIVPWFHAYTLDVISESSMGYKLNAQNDPQSKFVLANKGLLDVTIQRFYFPQYRIDWIWRLTSMYRKEKALIEYFHNFVDEIITKRRDFLLSEGASKQKRPALLDILLQGQVDGQPLSNEVIRAEVNNFMLAGHETTGTTLGFLAYILAKNQDVQQKVYEEICEKGLNNTEKSLKIIDLNSLEYFNTVIKETLRLYPILSGALKESSEDLRVGKIFVPANTAVCTAIRSIHLNEKHFDNPREFDPSRWEQETSKEERSPYTYQPFSAGLRNCIGQKFALLELKCLMVEILREFSMELEDPDFEIDARWGSLGYSKEDIMVKFKARH
ncbi:cytochrome P450 4d1-like [Culicoides brevitarsis]|uniref:cytochrome P450 4d1-like n=1 Tax=Culicoides brevitarsis TaxID=469753 RepID=UPI00307B4258